MEIFDDHIRLLTGSVSEKLGREQYGEAYYHLAAIYTIIGNNNKALEILREMENSKWTVHFLLMKANPHFDNLRENEEFNAMIQRQEKKFADIREEIYRLEAAGEL